MGAVWLVHEWHEDEGHQIVAVHADEAGAVGSITATHADAERRIENDVAPADTGEWSSAEYPFAVWTVEQVEVRADARPWFDS